MPRSLLCKLSGEFLANKAATFGAASRENRVWDKRVSLVDTPTNRTEWGHTTGIVTLWAKTPKVVEVSKAN